MVVLKRILEAEKITTPVMSQKDMFNLIKSDISKTDLVSLAFLHLSQVRIVSSEHNFNQTYVNLVDADKLRKLIDDTRENVRDNITPLEIAKNIDHSIDTPSKYKPKDDSLFTPSERGDFLIIPSHIMDGIKDLVNSIQQLVKVQIRIEPRDREGKSLRRIYRCESSVKAVTLDMKVTYNKKKTNLQDIKTITELKEGLKQAIKNPEVHSLIDQFKFQDQRKSDNPKYSRDLVDNILYFSLTATDAAHGLGYLDMSFRNNQVQLTMTGYRTGKFKLYKGVLTKVL